MFYLLLSVICSATLSIVMRLSEGKIQSKVSMLAANYLTCFLIAGVELISISSIHMEMRSALNSSL